MNYYSMKKKKIYKKSTFDLVAIDKKYILYVEKS